MSTGSERVPRQLGANLFADVVGYTSLMQDDEERIHRDVKLYQQLFTQLCETYGGRVVVARGDGFHLFFSSVVNSVQFAVEFQTAAGLELDERTRGKIKFRIGIHAGDVITEDGEVHGDSVNIAARIEALAGPGGICISREVYDYVKYKLPCGYVYTGPHQLKNVGRPVHILSVRSDLSGISMLSVPRELAIARGDSDPRKSLLVVPFKDLSTDEVSNWFSMGIAEDLINQFSKASELLVISRGTSFCFNPKIESAQQFAAKLDVDYIVDGDFTVLDNSIRVDVRFMEVGSATERWSERYDRDLNEFATILADMVRAVSQSLDVPVDAKHIERLRLDIPPDFPVHRLYLEAQQKLHQYSRMENQQARNLYELALESSPHYRQALTGVSRTLNLDYLYDWAEDRGSTLESSMQFVQRALSEGEDDATPYSQLGFIYLYRKEHEQALEHYRLALELNPNDTDIISDFANALLYAGQPEQCVELIKTSMHHNPFYPDEYLLRLGRAYYQMEQYDDAIIAGSSVYNPGVACQLLAASYAQAEQIDKARFFAEMMYEMKSGFTLEQQYAATPYSSLEQVDHIVQGLRLAGF